MNFLHNTSEDIKREIINGRKPPEWVNRKLVHSWLKSARDGRRPEEKLDLSILQRNDFQILVDKDNLLLEIISIAVDSAAKTLNGLEFGIMFTNAQGIVLHSRLYRNPSLRSYMQDGMDLSEKSVGASAMALAVKSGQAEEVSGKEHFFNGIQHLQCIAAPIYNPNGELIGAVNITTTSMPSKNFVKEAVIKIVRNIEAMLIQNCGGVCLQFGFGSNESIHDAIMSFGKDGEILGANTSARALLGSNLSNKSLPVFRDYFDTSFDSMIRDKKNGLKLPLLNNGMHQYVTLREAKSQEPSPIYKVYNPIDPQLLFGDPVLEQSLKTSINSLVKDQPVLLSGASGVGKTMAAKWLHSYGPYSSLGFLQINCATLQENGLFQIIEDHKNDNANATFYFRDFDLLSIQNQALLTEWIEYSRNISFICATRLAITNYAPDNMREDLFYMLRPMLVDIPKLAHRRDANAFLNNLITKQMVERKISKAARNALCSYNWPGNFREFYSSLRKIMAIHPENTQITLTDVISVLGEKNIKTAPRSIEQQENQAIEEALAFCNGNRTEAAKWLGISRATLHRRLNPKSKT